MLGHHVRDPEIWLDRHQLHRSEAEVVGRPSPVPTPVLPLGLRPVAGERQHESLSPSAEVIADVGDDLVAFDLWGGRITLDNPQRLHAAMVTWTIPLVHPRATLATSTFHAFRRDEDGILAIVLGHAVDRTPELEVPAIRVWKYSAYRGDEDPLTFAVIDRVTT